MSADAHMGPERFHPAPIEDILSPRDGHVVFVGRWWAFRGGSVFFFKGTPQCSPNHGVALRLGPRGSYPVYVTTAYVKEQI